MIEIIIVILVNAEIIIAINIDPIISIIGLFSILYLCIPCLGFPKISLYYENIIVIFLFFKNI